MAFTDQATLADNSTFRSRVRVAVATAAVSVMGEAQGAMGDDEFGKRQALAYEVLRTAAGGPWLEAFIWGVVANAAITDASNDGDLQFTVNALWADMSGVRLAAA